MAGGFGATWWGRAWVDALEASAMLDPSRLSRGRTYARRGAVDTIELSLGYAMARVRGTHGRWYRADVAVRALAAQEWEQVADAIAARAAHAAALLDGELDPGLVDDALAVDVRLLPGPGDLRTDCTCPDWAEPCKHAAALCYLVADELDRDPFGLFLLRGIERDDLLAMVRARRSGVDVAEPVDFDTVDAAEAWAGRGSLDGALDPIPTEVGSHGTARAARSGRLRGVVGDLFDQPPPAGLGIDVGEVASLAADAAARAAAMLADGAPSGLAVSRDADLARRASTMDATAQVRLAARLGMPHRRLVAWIDAWRRAGAAGVEVVASEATWSSDQALLEAGREALVEAGWERRAVGLSWNGLRTARDEWLVIGPDRAWYRLREQGGAGERVLTDGPADDPVELLARFRLRT